jgi:hypothetical protein
VSVAREFEYLLREKQRSGGRFAPAFYGGDESPPFHIAPHFRPCPELRGGWRTRSQVCAPGTKYRAPTRKKTNASSRAANFAGRGPKGLTSEGVSYINPRQNSGRMPALQELLSGWRTSSQVCAPGTACCAPTTAKAEIGPKGLTPEGVSYINPRQKSGRMPALQELRGGWRTSSQVCAPGTACCAPTTAKAEIGPERPQGVSYMT